MGGWLRHHRHPVHRQPRRAMGRLDGQCLHRRWRSGQRPTLHNWEANDNPANPGPNVVENEKMKRMFPASSAASPRRGCNTIVLYGLDRTKELGFAAGPIL